MKAVAQRASILALCLAIGSHLACSRSRPTAARTWDPKAAAEYLDRRETTWMEWPGAARDHGTFCVSCHTAVPYALSRPLLRAALGEPGPSENERALLDNVSKRVHLWNEVDPFYQGKKYDNNKAAESRGTEAVLNALILASHDAENGHLSDVTRKAFSAMWDLQTTDGEGKGSWRWLQFGMEPWEAKDSAYYGAALAAIAVGTAPESYAASPDTQDKLGALRDYLNREFENQSTINRAVVLWASAKLPGLLDQKRKQFIIDEVTNEQQGDGSWRLSLLSWPKGWNVHTLARTRLRADWTPQQGEGDGYATGLIVYALRQAGVAADDSRVKRGLAWLASNQSGEEGSWPSSSLTERRNPSSNVGHFMRDAATAYAVLALSDSGAQSNRASGGENRSDESRPSPASPNVAAVARSSHVQPK